MYTSTMIRILWIRKFGALGQRRADQEYAGTALAHRLVDAEKKGGSKGNSQQTRNIEPMLF